MDTCQILCTLRDVNSFPDVFPYDLLPSSRPVLKPCSLIFNADPHAEGSSHWLAIRLTHRSSSAYYFDSYGTITHVFSFQTFLNHNCTTRDYNIRQLQRPTIDVCGQYCCLLALYMERSFTPPQFITLFADRGNANRHMKQMFAS